MGFWIIPAAIFLGVMSLVIAVAMVLRDRQTDQALEERLGTFAGLRTAELQELPSLLREPIDSDSRGLLARMGSPTAWVQRLILQADLRFGPGPLLLVCGVLAGLGV